MKPFVNWCFIEFLLLEITKAQGCEYLWRQNSVSSHTPELASRFLVPSVHYMSPHLSTSHVADDEEKEDGLRDDLRVKHNFIKLRVIFHHSCQSGSSQPKRGVSSAMEAVEEVTR